ncbi:MAG: hypothetical protein HDT10_06945 [Helicobacter sp.]|nr:hypothetical protein [Helicobacter sp.]
MPRFLAEFRNDDITISVIARSVTTQQSIIQNLAFNFKDSIVRVPVFKLQIVTTSYEASQ